MKASARLDGYVTSRAKTNIKEKFGEIPELASKFTLTKLIRITNMQYNTSNVEKNHLEIGRVNI
ncbi:MAG: hypothetical protein ABW185_28405 [Sedimenticola sp.]